MAERPAVLREGRRGGWRSGVEKLRVGAVSGPVGQQVWVSELENSVCGAACKFT